MYDSLLDIDNRDLWSNEGHGGAVAGWRHELCEWIYEGGNMIPRMSRLLLIFAFIFIAAITVVGIGAAAEDGVVAEWHFEENSGNILIDSSGNGNNGTIYGATWTTDGKFGTALQFDGVNDYVEIPDSPELSGGSGKNKTVEFWFNTSKQGGHIITKWQSVSTKDWGASIGAAGPGLFFWYESGGRDRRFYGGTIEEEIWHHGAFTFQRSTGSNNAKVILYLDGEELDVINFDGVLPDRLYDMPDSGVPVSIGYSGKAYNSGYFDGKIDEIKVYDRVLSASEIKSKYDIGIDPSPLSDGFRYPVDLNDVENSKDWHINQNFGSLNFLGLPHLGEDWNWGGGSDDRGKPLFAISNGFIEKIIDTDSTNDGWGKAIILKHNTSVDKNFIVGTGESIDTIYSMYAHLLNIEIKDENNNILTPKEGLQIKKGWQVGTLGDANGQWGNHSHFEIRTSNDITALNGRGYGYSWDMTKYTDPSEFIDNNHNLEDTRPYSIFVHTYDTQVINEKNYFTKDGGWTDGGSGKNPDLGYNGFIYYASTNTEGWIKWNPNIPKPGNYRISAFIPRLHATTQKAKYEIYHNDVKDFTPEIDQSSFSDNWVVLGNYYFNSGTNGYVKLNSSTVENGKEIAADAIRFEYIGGLYASYYSKAIYRDDKNAIATPFKKRIDPNIDFDWQNDPLPINKDGWWSVDWTGFIYADKDGSYSFMLNSDDGSWLLIDGDEVVNNGGDHPPQAVTNEKYLTKGYHSIHVKYFNSYGGQAKIELSWKPPGENDYKIIPNSVMFISPSEEIAPILRLSKNAPPSMDQGYTMTYTLYYHNFGSIQASNVELNDTLPLEVEFISASDNGIFNADTNIVTWNMDELLALGHGSRTVTVKIKNNVPIDSVIQNFATLSYDDKQIIADAQTKVTQPSLPPDVNVEPIRGTTGGTPSVYWHTPLSFSYKSCDTATSVDINIHINDGNSDITGSMSGGPIDWTYFTTFYPRHGLATITYTVNGCDQKPVNFNIYIDPAGYIFDVDTGERIADASVWLQRLNGVGGWENVPTGQTPPISQPDENPLITGVNGQYKWDVLEGAYRVHVEADGYYPTDSIMVIIPPPVTDLHVGLTRIPSANQPPVAEDDTSNTDEDTGIIIDVAANDNDVDSNLDLSTATVISGPSQGTVVNNGDGTFTYTPNENFFGTDSFTYEICDTDGECDTAVVTIDVSPVNDPPVVSIDLDSQNVQYSDGITPITISATDIDSSSLTLSTSWVKDSGSPQSGLPAGLSQSLEDCIQDGSSVTCTWTLEGQALVDAGNYNITFKVSDEGDNVEEHSSLIVEPEDAACALNSDDQVAIQVASPGGNSGTFSLKVDVTEALPDDILDVLQTQHPGDINLAEVSISLVPVGPGASVYPISSTSDVDGTEYDATKIFTCEFNDVGVNTYSVQVTVNGGYYIGSGEDVLVIYDPSLGFTTGGGHFLWPETGEKTNFGYTMKYSKKGTNIQGNLLLVRHLPDGTIYRLKSNALYGLALGELSENGETYGWSSFSGKSTYFEPEWLEPEGNHEFIVYVEDHNEPGNGLDRFWIKVKGKDGSIIDVMSMNDQATENSVELNGGNIVVPHKGN